MVTRETTGFCELCGEVGQLQHRDLRRHCAMYVQGRHQGEDLANAIIRELRAYTAQLRHAYQQLSESLVRDQPAFARGLIAPAIKALETLADSTMLETVSDSVDRWRRGCGDKRRAPVGPRCHEYDLGDGAIARIQHTPELPAEAIAAFGEVLRTAYRRVVISASGGPSTETCSHCGADMTSENSPLDVCAKCCGE